VRSDERRYPHEATTQEIIPVQGRGADGPEKPANGGGDLIIPNNLSTRRFALKEKKKREGKLLVSEGCVNPTTGFG